MNEQSDEQDFSAPRQAEPEVIVLIKKMQQQLAFLEKKIDTLINQSGEKPFRPFSRPHDRGHYHDKREQGEDSAGRSFRHGHHFEKRRAEGNQRFGGPKKDYGDDRESGSGQGHYPKKRHEGEKRGFGPRKKPFFYGHKPENR